MLPKKTIKYVRKKIATLNSKLKKSKPNSNFENYNDIVEKFYKKVKEN
jgi:hemerythrin superfamily protein